jgi:hypothetical protein
MSLLEEAADLIAGDRQASYGCPYEMATAWSEIASAATGLDLKPEHLPTLMIAIKLARQRHGYHRDSAIDIAGYAGLADILQTKKEE